jgi:hypothetical protein
LQEKRSNSVHEEKSEMKRLLIILGFAFGASSMGFAQTILVQVGSNAPNTINLVSQGSGDYGLSSNWGPANGVTVFNQTTIDGTAVSTDFDTDPAIHYAFSANNDSDTTQTYTMTFSLPLSIALLAGQQVSVSSSISGSLAAGDSNPVQIGLGINPFIQQAYVGSVALANDAGVDLLNSSATPLTFTPTLTAFSTTFGPFPSTGSPNTTTYTLSANASSINVVTSFTLSANDSASLDGAFIVSTTTSAVPEPSEDVLLLAGLGVLLVAVLRRRRSA